MQHRNQMEMEAWGMKTWGNECRRWHQAAFQHNLEGVRTPTPFLRPTTVNPVHFFACNSVQSGGLTNSRAVLNYLLENGGDLHAMDNTGWLPINYAAWFGFAGTMDVLLELGSPVHHPTSPQPLDTALASVAQLRTEGAETCARLLLMHQADPNRGQTADQNYGGISWLTWALEHERWDWAELLWAKGARFLREKEIHLLIARGSPEVLAWAQFHGVDVLKYLPPEHQAHHKVFQTQAHVERENMMQAVQELCKEKEDEGKSRM